MPAKELTQKQLEDAARLKQAFLNFQAQLRKLAQPHSQLELAEHLPFNQSALSQYLNGRIPLNPPALIALSRLMGVDPNEISPSITHTEQLRASAWDSTQTQASRAGSGTSTLARTKDIWPFHQVSREKLLRLKGTQATAIQAAILGTAIGLGIDLAPTSKRKAA